MKKLTNFILLTIVFLFLIPSFATAQNLQERVEQSDLIIEGKVTKKQSYWNSSRTLIYTENLNHH
jgi:hypothetical protein